MIISSSVDEFQQSSRLSVRECPYKKKSTDSLLKYNGDPQLFCPGARDVEYVGDKGDSGILSAKLRARSTFTFTGEVNWCQKEAVNVAALFGFGDCTS